MAAYPAWRFFPARQAPPAWVDSVVAVFKAVQAKIDSAHIQGLQSDGVLEQVRPGLEALGFLVESGKQKANKIARPVLFGEQGHPRVNYEVDAVLDFEGVLLEVEAGRGMMGNAVYRDLIRTSLIVGARYLVLAVMNEYRYKSKKKTLTSHDYALTLDQLDAIFASGRLDFPFDGVLVIGY
jgi:hypothetical protein